LGIIAFNAPFFLVKTEAFLKNISLKIYKIVKKQGMVDEALEHSSLLSCASVKFRSLLALPWQSTDF